MQPNALLIWQNFIICKKWVLHHCNHLLVVCVTWEQSSTWVLLVFAQYNVTLTPLLWDEIIAAQKKDEMISHLKRRLKEGDLEVKCIHEDEEGTLWFKSRIVVLKNDELRKKILDEAHMSKYSIHPSSTKMYHDMRAQFWWTRMKRETACYVAECDTCWRVKADHLKPIRLLKSLSVPKWKWEDIGMDFVVGVPLTDRKYDSIWVIVDRLTKSAHYIQIHTHYNVRKYAELYIARILCLRGVLKTIILYWGSHFIAHF
jgi:hypothetical protein